MSSTTGGEADQAALPFDVEPMPRRTPSARAVVGRPVLHRLRADACGWPAGTELLVTPRGRLRRGDIVVADEGERRLVGVYEVRFGRPFLVADEEALWLGAGISVLGVVTVVSPPLPDSDDRPSSRPLAARGPSGRPSGA